MKKFNTLKSYLAAFAIVVGMGSCSDNDDLPEDPTKNIVEIVSENSDFSLLRAAVVRAGLVETLSGSGSFTVFAPNNDAFRAAGIESEADINAMNEQDVEDLLMYHVLMTRTPAASISNEMNAPVETAAEMDVYTSKMDGMVSVNGARVVQADVMASNGIIHVIDKVLMPAMGNIVEVAQENSNLSLLVAAVMRASQGSMDVADMLMGDGPYTVFAPTNQAFIDAGFANEQDFMSVEPDDLAEILATHVLAGRVYSPAITAGMTAETAAENELMFTLSNGVHVAGPNNDDPAEVTGADMTVTNGVVHVIDKVLMP